MNIIPKIDETNFLKYNYVSYSTRDNRSVMTFKIIDTNLMLKMVPVDTELGDLSLKSLNNGICKRLNYISNFKINVESYKRQFLKTFSKLSKNTIELLLDHENFKKEYLCIIYEFANGIDITLYMKQLKDDALIDFYKKTYIILNCFVHKTKYGCKDLINCVIEKLDNKEVFEYEPLNFKFEVDFKITIINDYKIGSKSRKTNSFLFLPSAIALSFNIRKSILFEIQKELYVNAYKELEKKKLVFDDDRHLINKFLHIDQPKHVFEMVKDANKYFTDLPMFDDYRN